MRTSSILVTLLAVIGLISFQQNCLSEIAPPDSPNEHKEKNIFDVGKQEFYLESLVARLDPSSVLRKPITRDTARIVWYLALIIAVLFSMLKLFRLMEGSAPLWTLKVPLILINVIVHPLIWILSLHSDYAKAFYLKEGSAFELMWFCLISIIWLGLNWIYVNQCASGSRAFLAQGILLTGVGLLIVSTAILNKGELALAVTLLAIGLLNLVPSLLKSAKEFRGSARLLKQGVPIQLGLSILLVIAICVAYVAGDIINCIRTNWKLSLYLLLLFIPGLCFFLVPIYWGCRWRDGLALRFYQLLLLIILFGCFLIFPLSGVAKPVGTFEVILATGVLGISIALTFHSSVRKWARELKPAL
jgi:hypothetical protein